VDCGANIGVMTVEWSRMMMGWGTVFAIEAQERVFNALAGNIAINNCFNAHALYAAVGASCGVISVPELDPTIPSNFGGLELKPRDGGEWIGQHSEVRMDISCVTLDSFNFPRVDFIKLDVEGMEVDALEGAAGLIKRCRPAMMVEYIKNEDAVLRKLREMGYRVMRLDEINYIALHGSDEAVSMLAGREVE